MIIQTLNKLFSTDRIKEDLTRVEPPENPSPETKSIIIPTVYKGDVDNLTTYIGAELKEGLVIELSLQELLEICPRERKRSDAYKKLIDYLAQVLGVTLTIKKRGE